MFLQNDAWNKKNMPTSFSEKIYNGHSLLTVTNVVKFKKKDALY